ncbi:aldehyde dehydrogenase family protein [Lentisalinibacter sediminis]|uniref:aldehyde dehydrogenase family protein n=1 Tax=Lentisalinibacter sediminis TaxID=2992237 RepID=UPI00386F0F48
MSDERLLDVRNPRTGERDYRIAAADAGTVAAAAARLRSGQAAWAARPLEERVGVLDEWVAAVDRRRQELLDALVADTGRYFVSVAEIGGVAGTVQRWSRLAPEILAEPLRSSSVPGISYRTQLVPVPLVGAISPWNFPLTLSLIDAIPALIAGCAVLVKPSEVTPRFVAPLAAALAEVPALDAVLGFVQGDGATGAALIDNVDAVCFTGSVATGRKVGAAAAARFIPAFLELGGKDPMIVLASADPKQAAATALRASVTATGQACQSIERVYVAREIFDEFVAELVAAAERVALNWPDIHDGHIGPLIFERQAATIRAQLEEAVARGARIVAGGEIENLGGGLWIRPTVVTGVDHEMALMREETFGPVIPVMPFDTLEEAIALANDSEFGLSAAVLAGSLGEAEAVGRQLEAGAVSLNDGAMTAQFYEAEKDSFKYSGLGGSRMGPAGMRRFLRRRALIRQENAPATIEALAERHGRP